MLPDLALHHLPLYATLFCSAGGLLAWSWSRIVTERQRREDRREAIATRALRSGSAVEALPRASGEAVTEGARTMGVLYGLWRQSARMKVAFRVAGPWRWALDDLRSSIPIVVRTTLPMVVDKQGVSPIAASSGLHLAPGNRAPRKSTPASMCYRRSQLSVGQRDCVDDQSSGFHRVSRCRATLREPPSLPISRVRVWSSRSNPSPAPPDVSLDDRRLQKRCSVQRAKRNADLAGRSSSALRSSATGCCSRPMPHDAVSSCFSSWARAWKSTALAYGGALARRHRQRRRSFSSQP